MSTYTSELEEHREMRVRSERESSIQGSRRMALEIGSELTPPLDRARPAAVFRNAGPIRDWLLGDPDASNEDRYFRRRAAQLHLHNLQAAAAGVRDIKVHGVTPGEFTAAAQLYYDQIIAGTY